ncbi:MarR family winged helix-turn-helix transcriptional regulator [Saccharomonospora xinjiangensis]|uniref:Transcriptional regulator n=1 Tax=Saccharomonospora xinjiangensis XJ-54 TaxID=882086 RepID=I0V8V7_9PSEU|nr:MarR family winged helix-turn-helix transcriptional regulator [Saccharomonospora xinjiangensis]EID56560.1 transcriptional regulator [Saccharomonospora xinjiangensis XJ-54]QBQ60408.1 Multidrug resistance operon repressor [Saccharomonospora xinjiangensis]
MERDRAKPYGRCAPPHDRGGFCLTETALYWLVLLARLRRTELARDLAELGMYSGQEQVLLQRWDGRGFTQSELAGRVQAAPATITRMLQRMERAGLVRRERGRGTRGGRVFLTERGWAARDAAESLWLRAEERLVANLSGSEYASLRSLLTKLGD